MSIIPRWGNRKRPDRFLFPQREDDMRKQVMAGAAVGAALLGGAAFYYFRERSQEEPEFRALARSGSRNGGSPQPITAIHYSATQLR